MQKKWVLSGLLLLCFSASAEWKLSFVVFSDLNGLGEVLESFTKTQIKWEKIDSDEDITKIHRIVCGNTASR